MTTQPDALRLADLLEMGSIWQDQEKAAAELRRLSAVEAQRDALLKACKLALEQISPNYYRTRDTIRAAIKAVEGGNEMTPTPTNKLRFVERKDFTDDPANPVVRRILQQWWEPAFFTEPGEWRDVPVEMEEGEMTREAIIRMAREARLVPTWLELCPKDEKALVRFAALVAAAEREACAKVCEAEGKRVDASWVSCASAIRARGNT